MDPVTTTCPECEGRRFHDDVLKHRVGGRSIVDVLGMTAVRAAGLFEDPVLLRKLRTLDAVGLTYLTLGQPLSSLSGGERQRIKLATQLHRTSSVYVLDEPTTGLHLADTGALVDLLDRLVDAGSTVICVEHNLDVVKRADWVIDLGPDGGKGGGALVFEGTPAGLLAHPTSVTGRYLRRDPGGITDSSVAKRGSGKAREGPSHTSPPGHMTLCNRPLPGAGLALSLTPL